VPRTDLLLADPRLADGIRHGLLAVTRCDLAHPGPATRQAVTEQIVLAPDAKARAAGVLAGLPQPFTTAEARQALGTTRRVAIPLLEYLDRAGITRRLPDDRRRLRLTRPHRNGAPSSRQLRDALGG
jgi:hypothetical protein